MAVNTGQTAPDNDWLASLEESILEPDIAIVDPHHHLWLRNGYTYLLPEFAADIASGHNIVASVFAECHSMYRRSGPEVLRSLGETEFFCGQSAMATSGTFGVVSGCDVMFGNVDLMLGDAIEPLLEAHLEASAGRFRGVRISTGWHPHENVHNVVEMPHVLLNPKVKEAAAVLDRMALTLDCWVYHTQLDEVIDLADAYPNLTIILNHAGSPILGGPYRGKVDDVFADWQARIGRLGERENVFVKLGALPIRMPGYQGDRTLPPSSQEVAAAWQPWIDTCIDAFSPARSMYESNFPVQKRWCSYQVCWNAFKRISLGASVVEKRNLFAGAAVHAYRMGVDFEQY